VREAFALLRFSVKLLYIRGTLGIDESCFSLSKAYAGLFHPLGDAKLEEPSSRR
jgi:hypothetical protein